MIPLLMCPVVNRHDLMWRMLHSIDYPVDRLLIIDNGQLEPDLSPLEESPYFANVSVLTPPFQPLGYGGAINFTIGQAADLPWFMWASNDVVFHDGYLSTVAERMEDADGATLITTGFTWVAMNRPVVDIAGLIDEWSFFPIYYDDNDYHRRCDLAGVRWIEEDWGITHGDGQASATIRSDGHLMAANHRSFSENERAYLAKWGGYPGYEAFETPWNSGLPVWATRPDLAGRQQRRW